MKYPLKVLTEILYLFSMKCLAFNIDCNNCQTCKGDKIGIIQRKELQELLQKYIEHVHQCEGVNFIDDINSFDSDVEFSRKELCILRRMAN